MTESNVVELRGAGGSPKEYLESLTNMINELGDFLKVNDMENVLKSASYIKESAKGFGFEDLSNSASQLETGVRVGDTGIKLKAVQYMREFTNREILKHK